MKKTILALALTASAATLTAAQLVEAIVIRVGDRVVTRTQYVKRLKDGFTEIEQTNTSPADIASKKEEMRKSLTNDLIGEMLIKDRADRLGLSVSADEIKEAMSRLKEQYGIKSDSDFDESLRKSGMSRADMEARLRDTILMNKVFGRELRQREDLADNELRERYNREKSASAFPSAPGCARSSSSSPTIRRRSRPRASAQTTWPQKLAPATSPSWQRRHPTPARKTKAAIWVKSPAASSSPTSTRLSSTPPLARFSARSSRSPAGTS